MISQDTKDQIDDIATDIAVTRGTEERRQAINQEILNYAEKLEEKEIERIKEHQRADWFESEFNRMVANKKHEDARLEEKDKEIVSLNAKLFIKKNAEQELESKNNELTELKSWHDYYKERAEKGESILKSATDIHFVPGKEGENLLASKDHELAQLKEISEKTILILEKFLNGVKMYGDKQSEIYNEGKLALTTYAEWCKQKFENES